MQSIFAQIEDVMLKQYLQDIARAASASRWMIFRDFFINPVRNQSFPASINKLINESIDELEGGVLVGISDDEYEDNGTLRLKIAKKVIAHISDGRSENWEEFHSIMLSKLHKLSLRCDRMSFQQGLFSIAGRWEKIGILLSKLQKSIEYVYESEEMTTTLLQDLRKELVEFYRQVTPLLNYTILEDFYFKAKGNYGESTHVKRLFIYTEDRPHLADIGMDCIAISNLYYCIYNILYSPNSHHQSYTKSLDTDSKYSNTKAIAILDARFGSTIVDILGVGKVVDLLEKLIVGSISFFRDSFDNQRKIEKLPDTIAALDKLLDFRNKLHEAGLDTSQMDQKLEESAVTISVNMNILLQKKSKMTVNKNEYSLGNEKKTILEEHRPSNIVVSVKSPKAI